MARRPGPAWQRQCFFTAAVLAARLVVPTAGCGQSPAAGREPPGNAATPEPFHGPAAFPSFGAASPPAVDAATLQSLGIRRIAGRHLTLYTDLPPAGEVDELPGVFDAAVPQWCSYFSIPVARAAAWKLAGSLIRDKTRFERAGLVPPDLPPFLHGYQRDSELWLYEQPSAYYRRHLLLHEGTHAFMRHALGGSGAPWYFEGMAELLATHRWQDGRLTLNYFPADKREVEEWGRIKIVRDVQRQGTPLSLAEIVLYDSQAHLRVEPYGWSWAAAAFFDRHPRYQRAFRELQAQLGKPEGQSADFLGRLPGGTTHLQREWELFVARLDYGYDVAREAILPRPVEDLPSAGGTVRVAADRGWQSSGWRLAAGQRYRLEGSGRYALAREPHTWWCEPGGVTIRYCEGRPLGMLLGAIVEETPGATGANGFLAPAPIGPRIETTLRRGGTLYLRINDFPSELADNEGEVSVRITPLPDSP